VKAHLDAVNGVWNAHSAGAEPERRTAEAGSVFWSAGKPSEEFLLVHVVFERFTAVDEDYRNLVVEIAAQLLVGVDIDLAPVETAAAMQLDQAFLHDLAQVTPLASVKLHFARLRHSGEFSIFFEKRATPTFSPLNRTFGWLLGKAEPFPSGRETIEFPA
jgi:hypothetical protein